MTPFPTETSSGSHPWTDGFATMPSRRMHQRTASPRGRHSHECSRDDARVGDSQGSGREAYGGFIMVSYSMGSHSAQAGLSAASVIGAFDPGDDRDPQLLTSTPTTPVQDVHREAGPAACRSCRASFRRRTTTGCLDRSAMRSTHTSPRRLRPPHRPGAGSRTRDHHCERPAMRWRSTPRRLRPESPAV